MEDSLQEIIEQNNRIIGSLENIERDLAEVKNHASSVNDELQWHQDLSAVSQIIKAIESVEAAFQR